MRRLRTLVALLLAAAFVSHLTPLFAPVAVAAQASPQVGDAVPVTDDQGTVIGSITVTDVIDPFTDVNPDYPAEAGSRYVVATVAFDADAGTRFDITPWTIVLQDDAGFLWNQASLVLPDDALIPPLPSQTLAPGSRVTGLVGFVVPEDRSPARIFYQPQSSRVVPLAELSESPAPQLGETVALPDSQGGVGSVTVSDVVDPFDAVEEGQTPPEGTRFVQVTLVYENSSDGRFFIEPYGLLLRDANGDLWNSTSVSRPNESEIVPDLSSAQLAPGDRLSGVVTFAVPVGVGVTGIYDSPVSGQFLQLAALPAGGAAATGQPATEEVATPTEEAPATTTASSECDALGQWLSTTRDRIHRAAAMSVEDATLSDPASLAAHADEYASLANEQLAETPPPAAAAANKALAATFNAYSASLQQILSADEPGKDTTLEVTEGMNTFNAAGGRIQSVQDELAKIAADCGLS